MTLPGPHSNGNQRDPAAANPNQAADENLAERLRAMGLGAVGDSGDVQDESERPITRLTGMGADASQQLSALGAQMETLSAGLAAQGDHLRDSERSLVDRIADVDDDRRRTQGQLQRAMQSQYEEIDARLRRQGALTTLGLVLITALAAGGLYLIHHLNLQRAGDIQRELTAEVQTLGLELGRLTGVAAQGGQVEEKLAALSQALTRVSEDLAQVGTAGRGEAPAAGPAVEVLSEQVARLESDQQRLSTEVNTLQAARQVEAPAVAPSTTPPAEQIAQQVAGLQSDQQRLVAEIDSLRAALAAATAAPPASDPDRSGPAEPTAIEQAATRQTQSEPASGATPVEETRAGEAPSQATPQVAGESQPDAAAERSFALQLIGSYDRNAVLELAARTDLPESVYIRQETLRGRPWYVLIHSLHPSYAEAQATLRGLPADLARLDTWIRSLPPDAAMEPIRTGQRP